MNLTILNKNANLIFRIFLIYLLSIEVFNFSFFTVQIFFSILLSSLGLLFSFRINWFRNYLLVKYNIDETFPISGIYFFIFYLISTVFLLYPSSVLWIPIMIGLVYFFYLVFFSEYGFSRKILSTKRIPFILSGVFSILIFLEIGNSAINLIFLTIIGMFFISLYYADRNDISVFKVRRNYLLLITLIFLALLFSKGYVNGLDGIIIIILLGGIGVFYNFVLYKYYSERNLNLDSIKKLTAFKEFVNSIWNNHQYGKILVLAIPFAIIVYIFSIFRNEIDYSSDKTSSRFATKFYCSGPGVDISIEILSGNRWKGYGVSEMEVGNGITLEDEGYVGGNIRNDGLYLNESFIYKIAYFKGNDLYLSKGNSKCMPNY